MRSNLSRLRWPRPSGTLWIFAGLALGIILGGFLPEDRYPFAYHLFGFLSKAFLHLIKGLIVPLLVSTIIVGVGQTGNLGAVGRMGGRTLIYFELVSTAALVIGLVIVNVLRPGAQLPLNLGAPVDVPPATQRDGWELALHIFPSNLIQHAAEGDILPLVTFSTLFGISLTRVGEAGAPVLAFFESVAKVMFKYTDLVMRLTPLGVLGAIASNVSHMASAQHAGGLEGWPAVFSLLGQYARLVGSLYLALFCLFGLVFVPVLGLCRVRVLDFVHAIRKPAITAFSTTSSEAALPSLLEAMVDFGVPRRIASFVIPTGYSFNLDGSTLYLALATVTIAQAARVEMPLRTQLVLMLTLMLTSKGAAGVPRATLVVIAGTCASFGLPAEAGVATLLAVDQLMDMARTTVNVVGNGLASVVIARWEGALGPPANALPSAAADIDGA